MEEKVLFSVVESKCWGRRLDTAGAAGRAAG